MIQTRLEDPASDLESFPRDFPLQIGRRGPGAGSRPARRRLRGAVGTSGSLASEQVATGELLKGPRAPGHYLRPETGRGTPAGEGGTNG